MKCAYVIPFVLAGLLFAQSKNDNLGNTFKPIYTDYDRAVESRNPTAYFANFAAPNYVFIDQDGSRKNLRQMISDLNSAFQQLPPGTELHLTTTVQRVSRRSLGLEVEVLGQTHLETTAENPKTGAITGSVADIIFSNLWTHTVNGWKLRVEKILSRQQKTATAGSQ